MSRRCNTWLRRGLLVAAGCACVLAARAARAETVEIPALQDATLIEDPDGGLANGSGSFLFAGRTNQSSGGTRRSLIAFDVAAVVPANAIVTQASLRLYLAPSNPGPRRIALHRVLAAWGEGPSSSAGGLGAPAEPGDVTWLHTFYDTVFWEVTGGQFVGRPSAHGTVDEPGFVTWTSTRRLVNDVTLWLKAPSRNFGWMLIGDETERQTAKSFASRENLDETLRPVLSVTYRIPAEAPVRTLVEP
jgi:hypothetical protein